MSLQMGKNWLALKTDELRVQSVGKRPIEIEVFPKLKNSKGKSQTHANPVMLVMDAEGLKDFGPEFVAMKAIDAASFAGQFSAVIREKKGLSLVQGKLPPVEIDPSTKVDLINLNCERIAWPKGLIWAESVAKDELFSEAKGNDYKTACVVRNEWGTAVVCIETGLVAIQRIGSKNETAKLQAVTRLPSQAEANISAQCLEKSVLITFSISNRESALLEVSDTGELIHWHSLFGFMPAIVTQAGIVFHDGVDQKVYLLNRNWKVVAEKDVPFWARFSATNPDRNSFAIQGEELIWVGEITDDKKIEMSRTIEYHKEALKMQRTADVTVAQKLYIPQRVNGEPTIGFAAGKKLPVWQVPVDGKFDFYLPIQSSGEAGSGIRVLVSGKALSAIDLEGVKLAGEVDQEGKLQKQADGSILIEFPEFDFRQAIVYPFSPEPKNADQTASAQAFLNATQFDLFIRGKAKTVSQELITITVSAMKSKASPLKSIRPIRITSA